MREVLAEPSQRARLHRARGRDARAAHHADRGGRAPSPTDDDAPTLPVVTPRSADDDAAATGAPPPSSGVGRQAERRRAERRRRARRGRRRRREGGRRALVRTARARRARAQLVVRRGALLRFAAPRRQLEKRRARSRSPWAPSSLFGRAHHQRVIPFVCEDGDEHKEGIRRRPSESRCNYCEQRAADCPPPTQTARSRIAPLCSRRARDEPGAKAAHIAACYERERHAGRRRCEAAGEKLGQVTGLPRS